MARRRKVQNHMEETLSREEIERRRKERRKKEVDNICQIFVDRGYNGKIFLWWHARTYHVLENGHIYEGEIQCGNKKMTFHFDEAYVMNYKKVKR